MYTIWTINITPADDGSLIVFEEVATGSSNTNLTEMAKAVDFVKGEAIKRLASR